MQIDSAGDRALLVSLGEVSASALHAAAAKARAVRGVVACIIGHSSLYVIFENDHVREAEIREALSAPDSGVGPGGRHHEVVVSFAEPWAPDLGEFLFLTRLTRSQFIRRLSGLRLTARFLGFRAGFAYLDGWPEEWSMPRRPTSRPRVPGGSFAIAGNVAGFYPIDSPGGWNLLGRTAASLWDEDRTPPNLIAAGDTIVVIATEEEIEFPLTRDQPKHLTVPGADVISPGQLTIPVTAPDWRRVESGRPPGGPFDEVAAALATASAGSGAVTLECALVGPSLRFREHSIASWYGSPADVRVDGLRVDDPRQFAVNAGQELRVGRIRDGLRGYLAVGNTPGPVSSVERGDRHVIRAWAGPHARREGVIECEVTPQLDRVGVRLRPLETLGIDAPATLRSCGMQFGTVQLHPDGTLVAMGPDHPITGGYLQPFTVLSDERWKLGQLMAGEIVQFSVVSL